jgi:hypothetical protein
VTSDTPGPSDELVSLRATSQAHHAQLMPHVDRLLTLAEMVGRVECAALHALYNEEYAFVAGQLIPHVDAVEATLYDRLEALMGPRHTMAPMREEHLVVRQLVAEMGTYQVHADQCTWNEMEGLALRRALYRRREGRAGPSAGPRNGGVGRAPVPCAGLRTRAAPGPGRGPAVPRGPRSRAALGRPAPAGRSNGRIRDDPCSPCGPSVTPNAVLRNAPPADRPMVSSVASLCRRAVRRTRAGPRPGSTSRQAGGKREMCRA